MSTYEKTVNDVSLPQGNFALKVDETYIKIMLVV